MATVLNIEKKRGDTRRHVFIVRDADGVVVDISGWSAFVMSIHSAKDPVDASTEQESITGALITTGTDGRVGFTPAGTLPVGKYFYDAQALDANSEKITFAEGEYKVDQDRAKG